MRASHPAALALVLLAAGTAVACASGKGKAGDSRRAAGDSSRVAGAAAPRPGQVATSRDWENQSTGRVEELFVGRFPGVQVYQAAGGIQVRIRGATSLRGSNDPLYIIDGFPFTPGTDGLIAINPSDIAKIEVLKDAGQTAEYGSRGANGVVRITTKRGGK